MTQIHDQRPRVAQHHRRRPGVAQVCGGEKHLQPVTERSRRRVEAGVLLLRAAREGAVLPPGAEIEFLAVGLLVQPEILVSYEQVIVLQRA